MKIIVGLPWKFGLGGVIFVITNFDHLLGLNYPENLRSIQLGWVLGWFWVFDPIFGKKTIFGLGGSNFSAPTLIISWAWNTLKIWAQSVLVEFWADFWFLTPFLAKNWFWAKGGSNYSSHTLIICWAWTTLKIWAQSDLVEFLPDFGYFTPLFAKKLGFGLGVWAGKNFSSWTLIICWA